MIAIERETCALGVSADGRHGLLFFVAGELFDAILDDLRGEEAAIVILGWEVADVETLAISEPPPRSIQAPLTFLLLEAMRRLDEGALDGGLDDMLAEPAPETLLQALVGKLAGLTGACLIDYETGRVLEQHFDPGASLDAASVGEASLELARSHLEMVAGLGITAQPEEAVVTCDDLLLFICFVRSGRLLVLVADPERIGIPAIRAALHSLDPDHAEELAPWRA
jgi:CheY-like chemotaxis protein